MTENFDIKEYPNTYDIFKEFIGRKIGEAVSKEDTEYIINQLVVYAPGELFHCLDEQDIEIFVNKVNKWGWAIHTNKGAPYSSNEGYGSRLIAEREGLIAGIKILEKNTP